MKIYLKVKYSYHSYYISFIKMIELDFAPYYDLILFEEFDSESQNIIKLTNNEYQKCNIYYNIQHKYFDIYVENYWKQPVTNETIDDIIQNFNKGDWQRTDNINIEQLKELMYKNSLK